MIKNDFEFLKRTFENTFWIKYNLENFWHQFYNQRQMPFSEKCIAKDRRFIDLYFSNDADKESKTIMYKRLEKCQEAIEKSRTEPIPE